MGTFEVSAKFMGVSMEKVELVFQVCSYMHVKHWITLTLYIHAGPSSTTVRGSCCYENVWTGKNQCQFADLLDQQEILWHLVTMLFVTVTKLT